MKPWWALGLALLAGVALVRLPLLWAGALLGGTAVLILSIIQPLFAMGLALLLAPFGAYEARAFTASPLDSGQLFFFFTLALWLARGMRQRRIVLPKTPLTVPLLLFIYITLITLLDAPSLAFGLKEVAKWVEMLLLIWLALDLTADLPPRRAPWILFGMLALAALGQGLFGIYQFVWRGEAPEHFMVLGRFYRAFGTFDQPNPYGGYMNLTAMLSLGALVGVVSNQWSVVSGQWRKLFTAYWLLLTDHWILMTGLVTAVTLTGVLVSWSRGAWLGLVGGTAVLVLFLPRKRWQGAALLLAAGVALGGLLLVGTYFNRLPAGVMERITSGFTQDLSMTDVRGVDITDTNFAVVERLAHWQAALGMARDNLWLGVGFGNYEPVYPDYRLINWAAPLGHAHNYYLNLLAETGVLGLAAYVLFWTAVFWQNIVLLRRLNWPQRGLALGLLAAWTALAVHQLVDKLYVNNIYIHLGVMLGLQQVLFREVKRDA
ncbi:MAG: O-antigen ligase family protein [Ardenticatenaceae bacterium]|nr:O-antigen ligase family protein [Ardenticatenaceae bacterium]